MAFFKFRKAGAEQAAPAPAPESVEAMRKRARYRLLGAAMLVLAGVVGFPLVFDNQPRPIAVDLPIEIPDKTKLRPLVAGAADTHQADASAPHASPSEPALAPSAASAVVAAVPASQAASDKAGEKAAEKASDKAADKSSDKAADKATAKGSDKAPEKEEVVLATSKPAPKPETKADSKADAKPEHKPDAKSEHKPDASGRFVVQFGAFTDATRAHEARMKVEKTGLKTYAQIAEGPEGKKYRVRVGPFEKRSEAEKAAEKIKKLDLPVSILGL